MTNLSPNVHMAGVGGCDGTTPPHLLPDDKWVTCHNMRPFNGGLHQIALQTFMSTVLTTFPGKALITIPTGVYNRCFVLALSDTAAYRIVLDYIFGTQTIQETDEN